MIKTPTLLNESPTHERMIHISFSNFLRIHRINQLTFYTTPYNKQTFSINKQVLQDLYISVTFLTPCNSCNKKKARARDIVWQEWQDITSSCHRITLKTNSLNRRCKSGMRKQNPLTETLLREENEKNVPNHSSKRYVSFEQMIRIVCTKDTYVIKQKNDSLTGG